MYRQVVMIFYGIEKDYSLKNVFLQTKFQTMKRFLMALFVLCGLVLCANQMSAQAPQVAGTAEQLGYYLAHQDGIKAGLMLVDGTDSSIISGHMAALNNRMEAAGGFTHRVNVVKVETISETEAKVTLRYECANDKIVEIYYFLLIDNQWKWDGKKL